MFDLQSCRITGRETRSDASNMFTVHIASYESTFVYDVTQSLTAPSEYNLLVERDERLKNENNL